MVLDGESRIEYNLSRIITNIYGIQKFTIYGERCSGTNYLENIMLANFNINVTWEFGWKHFFGFNNDELKNSDDTLFICIVRDPVKWINSFYKELHHLKLKYITIEDNEKIDKFLNDEFWSFNDNPNLFDIEKEIFKEIFKEIMEDRNIYTGDRYKNIFELRYTKLKFLLEDLPKKLKIIYLYDMKIYVMILKIL